MSPFLLVRVWQPCLPRLSSTVIGPLASSLYVRTRYLPRYVMSFLRNASGLFIWLEGLCLVRSYLLPLKPLDYQLIYAAHHLYLSFLYIQGSEGTVRLLSTTRGLGQVGKVKTLHIFPSPNGRETTLQCRTTRLAKRTGSPSSLDEARRGAGPLRCLNPSHPTTRE